MPQFHLLFAIFAFQTARRVAVPVAVPVAIPTAAAVVPSPVGVVCDPCEERPAPTPVATPVAIAQPVAVVIQPAVPPAEAGAIFPSK
jgi:hypothetical protein